MEIEPGLTRQEGAANDETQTRQTKGGSCLTKKEEEGREE